MRSNLLGLAAALGCLLTHNFAQAHVSAAAVTPYANATSEVNFNVGHGCDGLDTYSVKITIPASVTGVRVVENGSFASVSIEKDAAGAIKSVTFTKAQSAVRAADEAFYKLVLRLKLPNKPFSTVYFPANQVCKSADGTMTKPADWVAETAVESENGPLPAPAVYVLPARVPGWNKLTLPEGVELSKEQLATVFKDALIVWSGEAAFSVNPNTTTLIAAEEGVTPLEKISAGAELWVKY
jgi:uncharacterized protein YcnI